MSKTNDGLTDGQFTNIDIADLNPNQLIVPDAEHNLTSLASGASGFVLTSNGTNAPSFQAIPDYSGVLPVVNGGTGTTTSTGTGSVVLNTTPTLISPNLTTPSIGDAAGTSLNLSGLTVSQIVSTDSSKNLVSTATTGSGNVVLATSPALTTPTLTSPTLVTPSLGSATGTSLQLSSLTASQLVSTDASKNLVSTATTGSGTVVLATSPTLVTPILGAAQATSLNVSGLTASQVVVTDSSKNLSTVSTSGSGSVVLTNSPSLISPSIGAATGTAVNLTGTSMGGAFHAVNTTSGENSVFLQNTAGSVLYSCDGAGGPNIQAGGALILTQQATDVILAPNNAVGLRVKSGGNVNIPGLTASQVVVTDSSKNLSSLSNGSTGYVLTSNGSGSAPTFQTPGTASSATTLNGGSAGTMVYQSATNTTAFLTPSDGVLTMTSTTPSFSNSPSLTALTLGNTVTSALLTMADTGFSHVWTQGPSNAGASGLGWAYNTVLKMALNTSGVLSGLSRLVMSGTSMGGAINLDTTISGEISMFLTSPSGNVVYGLDGPGGSNIQAGAAIITTQSARDIILRTNNSTSLTVKSGGTINIPGLSGTGTRQVAVDSTGTLVSAASIVPTTTYFSGGASGNYTTPSTCKYIKVTITGGGGCGGSVGIGSTYAGGGGGAGGTAIQYYNGAGAVYNYSVGSGGTQVSTVPQPGGATVFSSMQVTGGSAGVTSVVGGDGLGGAGGTLNTLISTCAIWSDGGGGQPGNGPNGQGGGGSSYWGAGSQGSNSSYSGGAGYVGGKWGGGGSGCCSATGGGQGGSGVVFIEVFY